MNNLAKTGSEIDQPAPGLTREDVKRFVENPAAAIPAEFRVPVLEFRCEWSHMLKSDLAVCMRVRRLIAEKGMRLEDIAQAFGKLFDRAGEFEFAGQLLAALAEEIRIAMRDRHAKETMARRRVEATEAATAAVGQQTFRELAAQLARSTEPK